LHWALSGRLVTLGSFNKSKVGHIAKDFALPSGVAPSSKSEMI
jgi:hypothetical protein